MEELQPRVEESGEEEEAPASSSILAPWDAYELPESVPLPSTPEIEPEELIPELPEEPELPSEPEKDETSFVSEEFYSHSKNSGIYYQSQPFDYGWGGGWDAPPQYYNNYSHSSYYNSPEIGYYW